MYWRGFLCFALVVAAFALVAPPKPHVRYPAVDQSSAREIQRSASLPLQQATDPALYKEPCRGTPKDRESDLCAQWTSADWTEGGVLVGILGWMALLIQIGFTWRALRQGTRATEAATKSAKHAEDAISVAREGNKIARETLQKQFRAYVSVSAKSARFAEGEGFSFTFDITNSGQSRARNVQLRFHATIAEGRERRLGMADNKGIGDLPASAVPREVALGRGGVGDKATLDTMFSGRASRWIHINVQASYVTVFDRLETDAFEFAVPIPTNPNLEPMTFEESGWHLQEFGTPGATPEGPTLGSGTTLRGAAE